MPPGTSCEHQGRDRLCLGAHRSLIWVVSHPKSGSFYLTDVPIRVRMLLAGNLIGICAPQRGPDRKYNGV
jgi:hypothetical protein